MESTYLTQSDFWQYVSLIVLGLFLLFGFMAFIVVKVFLKSSVGAEQKNAESKGERTESSAIQSQERIHFVSQQEFSAYLKAWRTTYQCFHAAESVFKRWLEGRQRFGEANNTFDQRLSEQLKLFESSRPLLSEQVTKRINEFLSPAKQLKSLGEAHVAYLASIGTRAQYTDFMQYDSGKEKEKARRLLKLMSSARLALSTTIYQRCNEMDGQ